MMESSGASDSKLARRFDRKGHVPGLVPTSRPPCNKANVTAREMLDSAFRQNFDEILPAI